MKAPYFAMAAVFVLVLMANSHGQEKSEPNAIKEGRVTALLQKAESLYEQGKIEAARVECHKAFLIDPYDVRVHRMIVRVPLILKDSGDEVRSIRVYRVTPPDSAMEMQRIRFRAISTGKLPPALNPQLGK
jgi:Tfp pilus assembly protein PilF